MGVFIKKFKYISVLIILPIIFAMTSLMLGAYYISPLDIINIITQKIIGIEASESSMAANIVWNVRIPRILGAVVAGGGLSVAGAVFQGLFKNPLASPYTLGISNGAGFGAAVAILLSSSSVVSSLSVQASAFLFGIISIGITFVLAAKGRRSTVTLVLAGMLVGALFSSLVSMAKYVADPYEKLPQIVFWLMGSLTGVTYEKLLMIMPVYVISLSIIFLLRWKINVLSIGDQEARSYGIDVKRDKTIVILACSALTALIVSIAGIIGWIGIVIPHLARIVSGHDFRKLVPVSFSFGICYVLLIDAICRNLTASEIPLGVVTGIVGTPVFIYFIYKGKVRWE